MTTGTYMSNQNFITIVLILHLSKSKYRSYNFEQREDKEANIRSDAT